MNQEVECYWKVIVIVYQTCCETSISKCSLELTNKKLDSLHWRTSFLLLRTHESWRKPMWEIKTSKKQIDIFVKRNLIKHNLSLQFKLVIICKSKVFVVIILWIHKRLKFLKIVMKTQNLTYVYAYLLLQRYLFSVNKNNFKYLIWIIINEVQGFF